MVNLAEEDHMSHSMYKANENYDYYVSLFVYYGLRFSNATCIYDRRPQAYTEKMEQFSIM